MNVYVNVSLEFINLTVLENILFDKTTKCYVHENEWFHSIWTCFRNVYDI